MYIMIIITITAVSVRTHVLLLLSQRVGVDLKVHEPLRRSDNYSATLACWDSLHHLAKT